MNGETLKRKPLFQSNLSPVDIICGNDAIVEAHYKAVQSCETTEDHEKAVKKLGFSTDEIELISSIYAKLRDIGYWPRGFDKLGNLMWGMATMGNIQQQTESHHPLKCDNCACGEDRCQGYSKDEIRSMKNKANAHI